MSPATSESARIVRAYADTPFGQVHYRHTGEGEPVVFLHQSAAWSAGPSTRRASVRRRPR